jgi:hypothetical protein
VPGALGSSGPAAASCVCHALRRKKEKIGDRGHEVGRERERGSERERERESARERGVGE